MVSFHPITLNRYFYTAFTNSMLKGKSLTSFTNLISLRKLKKKTDLSYYKLFN